MRHHNSVLHGLLKHIPWSVFDRLVDEHQADARVRRLTTRSQLVALLYGQLAGAASLREIETALASHKGRLYHLGARQASRSTLADANAGRPHQVFSGLFAYMAARANRGLRRGAGEAVRLIDSTSLKLSSLSAPWAHFSTGVFGAKAHVVFDPDADQPLYLEITPAKTHDMVAAKDMPIEPGATYVFDLGYYDFRWWATLDAQGCRIVTRLKSHTPITPVQDLPLQDEPLEKGQSEILADQIGRLPARQKNARKNPMQAFVRIVQVKLETGKILRIVSNDLSSPAREIADLYKRRWAIELFFRWIKQTLKIRHFLGTSENAVRIQIAVALIAYLLLRLAQTAAKTVGSPLAFARLVRANLMHRRDIGGLLKPPPITAHDPRQMHLALSPP